MIALALGEHGAAVTVALSADDALLVALESRTLHVVVTDLSLRGSVRDGLWLLRAMRGIQRFERLPVIAMTGRKERGEDLGREFSGVLIKPFEIIDLVAMIAGVCG